MYIRASDYSCGMTYSLPLSYWSPEKLYMTSSRIMSLMSIIVHSVLLFHLFCFLSEHSHYCCSNPDYLYSRCFDPINS